MDVINKLDYFKEIVKKYIENDLLLETKYQHKFSTILNDPMMTEIIDFYKPKSDRLDIMIYAIKNNLRSIIVDLIRIGYNTYFPINYLPNKFNDIYDKYNYLVLSSYYNLPDIVELLIYDGVPVLELNTNKFYYEFFINIYKNDDMQYLGKILIDYWIKKNLSYNYSINYGIERALCGLLRLNMINSYELTDEENEKIIINITNDLEYMIDNDKIKDPYDIVEYIILNINFNSRIRHKKYNNIKDIIQKKLKYLLYITLVKYQLKITVRDDDKHGILDLIAEYYNYDTLDIVIKYCEEYNINIDFDAVSKFTCMTVVMSILYERYDLYGKNILSDDEKNLFIKIIKNLKNYDVYDIFEKDNLLSHVIYFNIIELVYYLVNKVDINYINDDGKTCLDIAKEKGNEEIINYLISKNAITNN